MVSLNENHYKQIARRLMEAVGDKNYFNGNINYDTEDFTSTLRTTLMIYREPLHDPADATGKATRITDIIPVWWEYHTYFPDGEKESGFSWSELREYLF